MRLQIYSFSAKQPQWVQDGFDEYARRMPAELALQLRELKPEQRKSGMTTATLLANEAQRLRAALPAQARIIALDERGQDLDTQTLARKLERWRQDGDDVAFLIGSADGLDPQLKASAHERFKLSSMTLPHGLVRILLAEQLYRAWSILSNHPYHRV